MLAIVSYAFALFHLAQHTPVEYARQLLAGREPKLVIQLISFEIQLICKDWLVDAYGRQMPSRARSAPPPIGFDTWKGGALGPGEAETYRNDKVAERLTRKLAGASSRQEVRLARIQEMLTIAADQLQVPIDRLARFVFEWSPAEHRARITRQARSHEVIRRDKLNRESTDPINRDCIDAGLKTFEAWKVQKDLRRWAGLLDEVHEFGRARSTSQAVKQLARVIAFVSDIFHTDIRSQPDEPTKNQSVEQARQCIDFVLQKQRVHSGIDLLECCGNVWRSANRDGSESTPSNPLLLRDTTKLDRKLVSGLLNLGDFVEREITASRAKAAEHLIQKVLDWRTNDESYTIVTQGYSKTVREVLRKGLESLGCSRVFLLVGRGEDSTDARMMERDLEASDGEVGVGAPDAIASLLGPEHRILMLLGAECWDDSRVIHPRGAKQHIDELNRDRSETSFISVFIVAEQYKYFPDLVDVSSYFSDHLDNLTVYDRSKIDAVVSDLPA